MTNAPILVTGGAGFIGSHTCKALAALGYKPITLDNLSTGNAGSVMWGPLIEADLQDTERVAATLMSNNIDTVIHFAASAYIGESMTDPGKYYRNNVAGMVSLLEACTVAGVDKIIFSSSCATYGIPTTLPIRETEQQKPINPYGRTKLIGEEMLADYAAAYGLRYVILRYFNACGADPDGELAEWHDPETHIIPLALRAAAGTNDKLLIYGTDYDTPDGTCIRDYIHVCDLAVAHILALEHLCDGGENLAVNLGTGTGLSLLDVVSEIEKATHRTVPVQLNARRPGDPPCLYADASLARETLGFVPQMSDIESIVRTAGPSFGLELVDHADA
ncbi:UDP-glucose 4-epimerase GalE [Ahrensia sp. R2A130]|uniref:UDP-glucose 4-epimerase GalE n=1 Tax=Ahrensia sp. R2A130 TaxID=744979 RepID=UPI0001E094B2|nr:UDP-glucose 4-epimerase GalE [Ahrensia sp. R2A130]EFL88153.1 UDP-glucose 4-epimerase [Ahrensia sp. R2A130]